MIRIADVSGYVGQEVEIAGWLYNKRSSGSLAFLQLRDGSGFIQGIVSKNDVNDTVWNNTDALTQESSLKVCGTVAAHPKKEGVYELQVSDVEIIQISEEYPIAKKEHGPEFLADHRHLWLRSKKQWAIQRVRDTIIFATYDFFRKEGFIKSDAPILTPNACEGTTELFELDYFDERKAYLSQSGQLYSEAAIMAHGKVFDFGPVFRAEKSKTRRHLIEFWMMDAEMAFHDYKDNMDVQERLMKHILGMVLESHKQELEILERDVTALENARDKDFVRMTHKEAVQQLAGLGSSMTEDEDFGAEDEAILTQQYDVPVFVTHYPAEVKAFYMKRDDSGKYALCSDLLAPEGYGEIIGGSEREADYDTLLKRIQEHELSEEDFSWYLDLRRYGSVPHSGFGYGLERIVRWVCGIHHIRETIPFPRLLNRLKP